MNPREHATLSESLKTATLDLHRLAERSAFMTALLRGELSAADYLDWFCSLQVIYEALEANLPSAAVLHPLAQRVDHGLARSAALRADVAACEQFATLDSPCPVALAYAARISQLADQAPILLAAHVYVRYLGDLHGGRLMAQALKRSGSLPPGAGAFSEYSQNLNIEQAIDELKSALDALGETAPNQGAHIQAEAVSAFERHVALFESLEARRQVRMARHHAA